MRIIGVGIDLVELARVDLAKRRSGIGFVSELLNADELRVAKERLESVEFIAGRIAAKESVAKALGTGITGFHWHEIEISNDAIGRPTARLLGRAAEIACERQVADCLISIAHSAHFATAQAVAIGNESSGHG
jgi:holo-[acyl-carrier protein] synthase